MSGPDDDLAAERAVLADELQQRGDPQGELIALQLALAALPATASPLRRAAIERRIAAHMDTHHAALYGPLAPHTTRLSAPDLRDPAFAVLAWRDGFADSVFVQRRLAGLDLVDVVRLLAEAPIARLAREIVVGMGDHPALVRELARARPPSLRGLVFDEWRRPSKQLETTRLEAIDDGLETLLGTLEKVHVGGLVYRSFRSPTLRDVAIWQRHDVATCAFDADLPVVAHVSASNFDVDLGFFERYPALTKLHLFCRTWPAGWFERLMAWERLPALRELVLGWRIDETQLGVMLAFADRLAHLEKLQLSGTQVTAAQRAAMLARLPRGATLL